MLYNICYIDTEEVIIMARGKSGRIVLEIDTMIKRKLYLALEQNQTTLKDWFIYTANTYIDNNLKSSLLAQLDSSEDK